MRIDIHVHTDRYSQCGRSSPEAMVERAMAEGYDAMVFTEHNVFWPECELRALQVLHPSILLMRGAEYTSPDGEDFLVYGPVDPVLERLRRDPERLTRCVHDLGGAVVLAHPYRYHAYVPSWLEHCPVDAIEVMSSNIYAGTCAMARALARDLGLPCVAASDGHHVDSLGWYGLELEVPVTDEQALARCLRDGAFSLYVDPIHVARENASLERISSQIRRLVAQGYSDEAIRAAVPAEFISVTLIHGVREGRNMSRPVLA